MTTYMEKVRVEPLKTSAYGPVEVAWFEDHLEITALGAARSIAEEHVRGDDVVVDIRLETVPGAD